MVKTLIISGNQGYKNYDYFNLDEQGYTDVDAHTATWLCQNNPKLPNGSTVSYPVDIRIPRDYALHWNGGLIQRTNPDDLTWRQSYATNSACFMWMGGDMTVEGVRIHNSHDAIRSWARDTPLGGFNVRGCWISYCRDDAIEMDNLWSGDGLIHDCLVDGCYVFFSARTPSSKPPKPVVVSDSLIRMQAQPGPTSPNQPSGVTGYGRTWKWSNRAPDVDVLDCIFLYDNADQIEGFDWPSNVRARDNVIIIWAGPGDWPGTVPPGVTISKDLSIWDEARTKWLEDHPDVTRIDGVDEEPEPDKPDPEPDPETQVYYDVQVTDQDGKPKIIRMTVL